jgi:hypothetical protein
MQSASGAWESNSESVKSAQKGCGWSKAKWSMWEIGAMVAGFVVFWPIGLIVLFWKLKKGELWQGSAAGSAPWAAWKGKGMTVGEQFKAWSRMSDVLRSNSGNHAFEEYKAAELARLDEMRRKLEEDQKAFGDFMERVRRAKDKEEFERFMAERNAPAAPQASASET